MRRIFRRVWSAFISFYLLLLIILFIVGIAAPNTDLRGVALSVLVILFFLAIPMLPLSLLAGHWRRALLMIVPIAALAFFYGPQFLPRSNAAPGGNTLRVVTFNIQKAETTANAVAAIIRDTDADIVGIQELSQPAADYFQTHLNDVYPYQALHPQVNPYNGQGLLSRYPIRADDYWRNPQLEYSLGHMRAEVDINGTTVVVYNTHPATPVSFAEGFTLNSHNYEVNQVMRRVNGEIAPLILLGDFNMTSLFEEYRDITARFTDAFAAVGDTGFGFTFPSAGQWLLPPVARLDFIFYSQHFHGISAHVWPTSGPSDHRPVLAELALPG